MKVIHVLRKPCSESGAARNVLKHGTGGLNIDATRLGFSGEADKWKPGAGGAVYRAYMDGSGQDYSKDHHEPTENTAKPHDGGRWPANLILQHREGCRRVGTRKVKPSNGSGVAHGRYARAGTIYGGGKGFASEPKGSETVSFVGVDGTETVDAWDCEPGCPVAELDFQSGDVPTGTWNRQTDGAHPFGNAVGSPYKNWKQVEGDKGGASRFFKQVGGESE